ncbi:MAG: DUF1177 domain-containing protein [Candidatus Uhrbacteria bacterium]|nr:DUF1177 domain-containing protein [Candidatus Uhrbacteria bacterium]
MLYKEIIDLYELLDRPGSVCAGIAPLFEKEGIPMQVTSVKGKKVSTEFVKIIIPGSNDNTPTLGVIGRLGGIGARPERIGFVSDGDGAFIALCTALHLARARSRGDVLPGTVIVTTQLCTNAPTLPHKPVPFMDAAVDIDIMNEMEVDSRMDAIISIDTSRGNRIINNNNFAITATVKEGWILKVSEELITIMEQVTGGPAAVIPITMQDITPLDNGLFHFNSIMTPACATSTPVVGLAPTSMIPVSGCATGVTNTSVIDAAGRFVVEVAKRFTAGTLPFYEEEEYEKICAQYGDMKKLQR